MKNNLLFFAIFVLLLSSTNCLSSSINSTDKTILEENIIDNESAICTNTKPIHDSELLSDVFGDQKDFWTANLQTGDWFQVRATLLAVGNYCYIYMDNRTIASIGQSAAIDRCEIYRYEFDTTIYPKNCELVGHPNGTLGDIDNDLRITVFLVEGVGNYYLEINELPGYYPTNSREMVYVSSEMQLVNTIATICHETNHLFLFNYDLNEADFIIEGLAEFSMYYAGYMSNYSFMQGGMTLNRSMSSVYFSDHSDVSLFFFDRDYYSYASYGAGYMFMFYLAEKYGIQVITDLCHNDPSDGPKGIEEALLLHGYNVSFNELFLDFITACTIDELGIYDDLFGFVNTDIQISRRTTVSSLPYSQNDVKHRYYCTEIHELETPSDNFTLKIETPEVPRSLGLSVVIHDQNGWNISKLIVTGTGNLSYIHCNGENIETAYIITSLIKEGTPNAPTIWMESPYNLLDISFLEGHVISTTDETSFNLFFSLASFTLVIVILKRKKLR